MTQAQQYDQYMVDVVNYFYDFEIPEADPAPWARARLALLDAFGCAVESYTSSEQCRSMIGPIVDGQLPGGVRLPATQYALDPLKAAFDLGTMIRYLDHNDAYAGREWGHPSDMLGAIISVADWQCRTLHGTCKITLKTVLESLIKSYEVHCLFQHLNSLNKQGFDHTILVKAAGVVAVSWLLKLDKCQALSALSHVYADGGLLRCYRQSPNAGPRKGWAAGDACMRAVHLALLAKSGQPGLPSVLSDPKWGFSAVLLDGASFQLPFSYGTYAVRNTGFKLVAAEGHGISACNAALIMSQQLRERSMVDLCQGLKAVSIRTTKAAITIIDKKGPLLNFADRDHCLSYMVAVVLLKGKLPIADDYRDDSPFASDTRIELLRSMTRAWEDPQLTADYFNPELRTVAAGLTVTLADGTVLPEVLVEAPLGHASHPGTAHAVVDKFKANMQSAGYEAAVAERAIQEAELGTCLVKDFTDLFWRGSSDEKPVGL